jgi:D-alanine-D-alanine ligase
MNAGADGVEIGRFVKSLRGVLPDGTRWSASGDEVEWRYRGAGLPEGVAVTGVSLSLEPVDPREELERIAAARAARKARFPQGRSAGCAFKNPFPELPAGKALDIAGCKGLSRGGAEVSAEHANFILNAGDASEADFAGLMAEARGRVLERLGVALEPEVRFVSASMRAELEDPLKTPEILLLKGGESSERGVSLLSGAAVEKALETAGFAVESVDVSTLENAAAAIERAISRRGAESAPLVVFPVLHGGYGEDGRLQAVMEEMGVPFVGAGSKGCAMAMDKAVSKKTMEEAGIPTPRHAVVSKTDGTEIPRGLELPLVVKPAREGSSVGMAIVYSPDEWAEALAAAFEFDDAVVAEEFVEGAEITVGVVDGEVLPAVEIRYPGKIYDYDAKYVHGKGETLYFCPPESLSETVLKRAAETALAFAEAIESTALTRVDMMVPGDDVLVLEANNIPGFTSHSLLPKAAAVAGYPFPSLCGKLAMAALSRGAVTMRG